MRSSFLPRSDGAVSEAIAWPVAVSQTRTIRSPVATATRAPLSLNAVVDTVTLPLTPVFAPQKKKRVML